MSRASLYRICTALILIGFLMLIQPVYKLLFTMGVPVILIGVVIHAILDHMKEWRVEPRAEEGQQGKQL